MTRAVMRLLVLLVLLVSPALADGPCCPFGIRHPSPFELFDQAATVARIEITAASPLAFDTLATLEGNAPTALVPRERGMAECEPRPVAGEQALVFLDAGGRFVGGFAFHGYIANPSRELVAAIDAWSQSKTGPDRARVLVEAIANGPVEIAEHAVRFLVDAPELLDAIGTDERARIAAAAPRLADDSYVPLLLARLRVDVAKVVPRRMHLRTRATQLVRHDFESVTDPRQLLSAIVAARGGTSPRASAAFERCERLHRKRLLTFSRVRRRVIDLAPHGAGLPPVGRASLRASNVGVLRRAVDRRAALVQTVHGGA